MASNRIDQGLKKKRRKRHDRDASTHFSCPKQNISTFHPWGYQLTLTCSSRSALITYRSSTLKTNEVSTDVWPNIKVPPDGFSCEVKESRLDGSDCEGASGIG